MCKGDEESTEYLLIHCIKAKMTGQLIYSLFRVVWVTHFTIRGNLFHLAWLIDKEEVEESLEGHSLVLVLDLIEGKK